MSKKIKLGLLQMCSSADVERNLAIVEKGMQQAQVSGVEVLQLPENFAQMPSNQAERHVEMCGDGRVQAFLASKSRQYQVSVIAGSLAVTDHERNDDITKAYARCLVYDHLGVLKASYDKLHLYDVDLSDGTHYRESSSYQAGAINRDVGSVVELSGIKFGLSICYDLRFPEVYRALVNAGAQLVVVPAAFTKPTGEAHWRTLLRARAIENQVFVAAAAQVGVHANGRETWGHSMVIDPWGDIIAEKKTEQGLLVADIDLTKIESLRKNFPVLKHRRLL